MNKSMRTTTRVAVVGLGYVGLPLALLAARRGFQVVGIDVNEEKVRAINARTAPYADEEIARELKEADSERFFATSDLGPIREAEVVVICVPTPVHEDHTPNFEPLKAAAEGVGTYLQKGQLVILESTVNPGVTERVVLPILEERSGLEGGKDFSLAHCPERINPGDAMWRVENIPRVVGGLDKESLERAKSFYDDLLKGIVTPMSSLKEAEAVKIVENAFRDINIAFVNELAMSFSRMGIDIMHVLRGAATKPFAFMAHYPGCGVGGHCIPVDPYYLIHSARENGFRHQFLEVARSVNEEMPKFTAEQTMRALNERGVPVYGAQVALLGLAYKGDIDDCRESPAFRIAEHLKEYGARVRAFDPFVPQYSNAGTIHEALEGAQAAVVATNHSLFAQLAPRDFLSHGVSIVVDGRNCLSKERFVEAGITYRGIGR